MYFQKTKWGNAKKSEYNGYIYDSRFEAQYAIELDIRKKAGDILSWERQVKIPLEVNGYHICNYYIDYVVHHIDGTIEYVECKGAPTDVWKIKWKIFEALYTKPENILTVVMQGKYRVPKAKKVKKITL